MSRAWWLLREDKNPVGGYVDYAEGQGDVNALKTQKYYTAALSRHGVPEVQYLGQVSTANRVQMTVIPDVNSWDVVWGDGTTVTQS